MPDYDNAYDRRRMDVVESLIPPGHGRAADIGCHDGWTTRLLAAQGYSAIGVDLDPDAVARARQLHPELRFEVGSVERLGGDPWQAVLCLEVVEHVPPADQLDFLRSVRRILDDDGVLVLSTPGRYSLMSLYERVRGGPRGFRAYDWWDPTHVGVTSFRRLRRILAVAGFDIDQTVGFYFVPQRVAPPFALRGRLGRAGWDLLVRARPRLAVRPLPPA